jgi:hypothetical protein
LKLFRPHGEERASGARLEPWVLGAIPGKWRSHLQETRSKTTAPQDEEILAEAEASQGEIALARHICWNAMTIAVTKRW